MDVLNLNLSMKKLNAVSGWVDVTFIRFSSNIKSEKQRWKVVVRIRPMD